MVPFAFLIGWEILASYGQLWAGNNVERLTAAFIALFLRELLHSAGSRSFQQRPI